MIDGSEWSKDSVREIWITLKRQKGAHVLHPKKGKMQPRPLFHDVLGTGLLMVVLVIVPKDFWGGRVGLWCFNFTSLQTKKQKSWKNKHPFCHKSLNLPKRWSAAQGAVPSFDLETQKLKLTDHRILLNKVYTKCVLSIGPPVHGSTFQKTFRRFTPDIPTLWPSSSRCPKSSMPRDSEAPWHHEQTLKTCKTHQSSPNCRFNCYQFLTAISFGIACQGIDKKSFDVLHLFSWTNYGIKFTQVQPVYF